MTHIRCVLTRSVSNVDISQTRKFASVMCCYHICNVSDAFFSVTNYYQDVSLMRRFHIVHIDPGCYTVRTKLLIFHVHFVVCTHTHTNLSFLMQTKNIEFLYCCYHVYCYQSRTVILLHRCPSEVVWNVRKEAIHTGLPPWTHTAKGRHARFFSLFF